MRERFVRPAMTLAVALAIAIVSTAAQSLPPPQPPPQGGPMPPPPPYVAEPMTPPLFTAGADAAPQDACVCTPLLMNTNVNGTQSWWVRALGGPMTITVVASSVNPSFAETVNAKVFDSTNTQVLDLTASYPAGSPPGFEAQTSGSINALGGDVYRVEVSTPGANPQQPHFRLKFDGADSAATGSPSTPSFEHAPTTWYFNVGAGESLDLQVLAAGTPSSNINLDYTLIDPTGSETTGSTSATSSTPGSISGGAIEGVWALHVHPHDHYRLSKSSGVDRGIYLHWDSAGEGNVRIRVVSPTAGSAPFAQPVTLTLLDRDGNALGNGTLSGEDVSKFAAGEYTAQISDVPAGWTAVSTSIDFDVICDRETVVEFVVADVTPPQLNMPPDATLEAASASGAPHVFEVTATDEADSDVAIVCSAESGETFPLGTTTVVCTATDDSGNQAMDSFIVTVRDTVAPTGSCTESVNPSTKNVPKASNQNEDGFYLINGSDNLGPVTISLGGFTLLAGETVKFTQAPGFNGVELINTMGSSGIRHFRVGTADPTLTFTDAAGNVTTQVCYVAPKPK